MTEAYRFRRVEPADLALLARWVRTPAVAEWWIEADGSPASSVEEEDLGEEGLALWLVAHERENGGEPFAFIQDYDPHIWRDEAGGGHHFAHLPPGARGIDQFIGVPDMLGRGHGSAFIRAHCDRLMAAGAPAVGTDPHPANARAIRAYEKAGFALGEECETPWGRALLMERWP